MSCDSLKIRCDLENMAEKDYQTFSSTLVPAENILGVRVPKVRDYAKKIPKSEYLDYIYNADEKYFEETLLKGAMISRLDGDIEEILKHVSFFVNKITDWCLCDTFCSAFKITKKNKERVWQFITGYLTSDKPFDIRFAVVMMLEYYIEEDYINKLFPIFDDIKSNEYYVKMAVAWAVSICFVKFPDETMTYLKNNKLDDDTFNKALRKICESNRVDKETKLKIKIMKRG